MLHSFHYYYACYYALLCLFYQQQQAASITIIIDGATTNEWATRDEYQRLVDSSQRFSGAQPPPPPPLGAQGPVDGRQERTDGAGQRLLAAALASERLLANGDPLGPLALASPTAELGQANANSGAPDYEAPAGHHRAHLGPLEELELALDRLDLIEQEQRQQQQRLNRLKPLDQRANGLEAPGVAPGTTVDGHHSSSGQSRLQKQSSNDIDTISKSNSNNNNIVGARTLSDLVPIGDDDIEDPLRRLKERGSSPQKYCGPRLMDVLELVCQGRFYGGESEPQIVNPTIKSKRFIGYDRQQLLRRQQLLEAEAEPDDQDPQHRQPVVVSRGRKLRTLESDLDADHGQDQAFKRDLADAADDNKSHNQQHQQQQQYLSPSHQQQQQQQIFKPNIDYKQNKHSNDYFNANLIDQNVRNKHSKMSLYRRIRGASTDCCLRSCYLEELKPYCKP